MQVPFNTATEVEVRQGPITGGVRQIEIARIQSNTTGLCYVKLSGDIPSSDLTCLPVGGLAATVLNQCIPIPLNADLPITIGHFRFHDETFGNQFKIEFFDDTGAALSHKGCVYFNIWTTDSQSRS